MARSRKTVAPVVAPQTAQTVSKSQWGTWGTWEGKDGPTKVQVRPGVLYEVISLTDAEVVVKHDTTGTPITVARTLMIVE